MLCVKEITGALAQKCSVKNVFLKMSENSVENTCAIVSFLIKFQVTCNFINKEALAQAFYCDFCEISKSTFSCKTPLVATSEINIYEHKNRMIFIER